MAKTARLLLGIAIVAALLIPGSGLAGAKGCWRLVETKIGSNAYHKDRCGDMKANVGAGGFSFVRRHFKGVCNNRDESVFSAKASYLAPPKLLIPGSTLILNARANRSANTQGFFLSFGLSISTEAADVRCGAVRRGKELGQAVVHSKNNPASAQVAAKFAVPRGSKGESFALRYCPRGNFLKIPGGVRYIYKWDPDQAPPSGVSASGQPSGSWAISGTPEAKQKIMLTAGKEGVWLVKADGSKRFLKEGNRAIITVQDEIITSEKHGGRATITFPDGSFFRLKANSKLVIVSGGVKLKFGGAWFNLRKAGKRFQVVTITTICGSMGTSWSMQVDKEGLTVVSLFEGKLSVTNAKGQGRVILNPGQRTVCWAGAVPTPPQPFDMASAQKPAPAAAPATAAVAPAAVKNQPQKSGPKPITIFTNANFQGVFNGVKASTVFSLKSPYLITRITTYHHNQGKGGTPGSLALKGSWGKSYGPWPALAKNPDGSDPRRYWTVTPNAVLPAGVYTIVDSDPSTWSSNARSQGRGIAWVEGRPR